MEIKTNKISMMDKMKPQSIYPVYLADPVFLILHINGIGL